jgi:acyl carrier protein
VDREWSQAEIREYMGQELPDYMIPSYFMKIEGIPLDANGKINRKALPDPRITLAEEYEAPRDIIEEKLVTLWSEVLSPGNVFPGFPASIGINADFFHLGGHSLKATILAAKIHKVYNIKLPLTQIFKTPTIKGLAEFIKAISTVPAKDKDRYAGIELAEKKQYYPLSSAQKRMYILQQMEPTANAYNIPGIFQLQGLLDMDRLNSTFAALIQRHESLRTSFQMHMGKPVQRIQRQMPFEIAYFKASPLNDNVNAIIKEFNSYFDLSKAPLFRAGLIHWDAGTADKYILMIIIHHIIADGISADILAADFIALYAGKELPEIKFQYKDYSEWQNKEDWYKNIRRQKEYWRKQFENGIPVLNFPNDYERPAIHSFAGETLNVVLGKRESGVLNKLALAEGATMYMVLLSIFYILLFKITRQEDIVVGTPAAGRGHADLLNVAGVFVNTLALLNFPAPEKTFSAFLQEVKERTLSAFENQDYPFEDLAADLAGARHGQRNSFFDVMFDFQVSKRKEEITGEIIDGLSIKPLPLAMETGTSKFDFNLITCETGERIALLLEYSTSLYKKETMAMLLKHYGQIVHCVVKNVVEKVDIKIRDIELIDQNESDRIRSKILKDIEAIETVKNVDFDI